MPRALGFSLKSKVIANNGTGATSFITKSGVGAWLLSGANTYTGATTVDGGTLQVGGGGLTATSAVNLNGGTLLLAAHNVISNAAGVNFAGGKLATGGFSEGAATTAGLGTLTLSASSTLDFGTGNFSTLNFSGFTSGNSGTLSILNWSGTPSTAGMDGLHDRLILGGDATAFKNAFNQSSISFNGTSGFEAVELDANSFELVAAPVPEPSTAIAAVVLLGIAAGSRRRRSRGQAGA